MQARWLHALLTGPILLGAAAGCAKVDPGYEGKMKAWADQSCACYQLPQGESQKCFSGVKEPDVPPHWADAMVTNPHYAVREPYKNQVQKCTEAWRARQK